MGRNDIRSFSENLAPWIIPRDVNLKDKKCSIKAHVAYMMARTSRMFEWTGLPETIPAYILEQQLQGAGACFVTDKTSQGTPVSLVGHIGGAPDVYYRGTIFTSGNPVLTNPGEYHIGVDGFLVKNDHLMIGLMPLLNKYGTLIAENELSLSIATIMARAQFFVKAGSARDAKAVDAMLDKLISGDLAAVMETPLIEGITVQPGTSGASQLLVQLIEHEQYLKASEFNELGLNANYNMKRESLSMTESQLNDDGLLPLVDEMFACRKEFCDEWNGSEYGAKYGQITVDYASAWKDRQIEENTEPGQELNPTGKEVDKNAD